MGGEMIIKAMYQSICPRCGGRILPGTDVEYQRGQKAKHMQCASPPVKRMEQVAKEVPRPGFRELDELFGDES